MDVLGGDQARLLDGLTEAQAEAVISDGAPLCILAGAGSGKTRVLTRRIAHRVATGAAEPGHVLALTFTRKAAGELRSRLAGLGVRDAVAAGTFHSVAYASLRRRWADLGQAEPTLLDRKVGLLGRLRGRVGATSSVPTIDLAAEIEWAKARLVGPEGYEREIRRTARRPPESPAAVASLYERYEDDKRRRGLVDFDDLLLRCAEALAEDETFAASQRWRYRHLFVDEYQDVNPVQARLLEGWRGDRLDLCVVGDPHQAIYSWNGADPAYLTDFATKHGSATVVRLEHNFRSSPQVLAVAGAVRSAGGGPAGGGGLRPTCPDGPVPSVRAYATDRDEARGVARGLERAHGSGTSWSSMAVLARTHAQGVLIEEELRRSGVPYRLRGGAAFLDRPEIASALEGLRAGRGPLLARLRDLARPADDGSAASDGPAAERQALLDELVRLGTEYASIDPEPSPSGFTAWLTTSLRRESSVGPSDAVELATFHAAKGLEWPVVFLVGLERGLVPISHAKTDEARDEERRLLYVAITRAERELHCSWARQRNYGERTVPRQPSPWLEDIQAARAALANGGPGGGNWKDRVAEERRRLRAVDGGRGGDGPRVGGGVTVGAGADPKVLAALRSWRSGAARAAGVPAYVIFHDTTLAAVAEAQPTSITSLLALPGLGPVKAERYGTALLEVVAEHAS